jgi:hypothetical protein
MLTSTEWLALSASGIGVIGTLAGATITQAFANKRERKLWIQSRESQTELWEREDSLRFHNDKKMAYSVFIGKMHLWHSQMTSQLHGDYGGQAYGPNGGFDKFETEISALRAELELIAPPQVWTAAEVMWGAGAAIALTLALPDRYSDKHRNDNVSHFSGYLVDCIAVMREDLTGERRRLSNIEQPLTDADGPVP